MRLRDVESAVVLEAGTEVIPVAVARQLCLWRCRSASAYGMVWCGVGDCSASIRQPLKSKRLHQAPAQATTSARRSCSPSLCLQLGLAAVFVLRALDRCRG